MKQYIHEFTVHNFETDFRGDVRISNLLKYAQHVATYHCEDLGIGRDYMLGLGKVFLLGKMRGVINRLPRSTEKLTVKTTPFEPVRAQYQRLIDFYDESGALVVQLDTRWLLVDVDSKRIVRRMPQELEGYFNPPDEFEDFRIPKCIEFEPSHDVTVRYSHIDLNMHLNNTVYADLMCDCLQNEIMQGSENPIQEFMIVYHSEAVLGETVSMKVGKTETGFVCEGTKGEISCFESWIKMKQQ